MAKQNQEKEQKASRLHNIVTDWTAFMEKVKEKIRDVKTHNRCKRERDVKERCG
jgi:hypothetical protein